MSLGNAIKVPLSETWLFCALFWYLFLNIKYIEEAKFILMRFFNIKIKPFFL